jgi:hypothetical protein
MEASAGGDAVGIPFIRKGRLLAGVSCAALALACSLPTTTSAATYFVSSEVQLRSAITTANGDGDPSSTIVMSSSFSVNSTSLPAATKPVTIDTQGFTLSGSSGSAIQFVGAGAVRTLIGTFRASTELPLDRG